MYRNSYHGTFVFNMERSLIIISYFSLCVYTSRIKYSFHRKASLITLVIKMITNLVHYFGIDLP